MIIFSVHAQKESAVIDSLKSINSSSDSLAKVVIKSIIKEYEKRAKYDSAKVYLKKLKDIQDNTEDIIFYNYHLGTILFTDNPDSSRIYYNKAYALSVRSKNDSYRCFTLLSLGALEHMLGNDSISLSFYEEGIRISDSLQKADYKPEYFKLFKNKCRLNMTAIYIEDGQYEESNKLTFIGIKEARELQNDDLLARMLIMAINNNMAWLNTTEGTIRDKVLAEINSYLKEGLELTNKLNNDWLESYLLSAKYQLFYDDENFDSALVYIKRAYIINQNSNDKENMIVRGSRIARCYGQLGVSDSALYYADLSIELAKELNSVDDYYDVLIAKVEVLKILNLNRRAIQFLEQIQKDEAYMTLPQKERLYTLFKSILISQNQYKEALHIDSLLNNTKDSLEIQRQFETIEELKTKYETIEKEAKIKILELEDQESKRKIKSQNTIILLAVILILSLIVLTIYVIRTIKFKQRTQSLILKHKILRAQINPHFFFNALQALQFKLLELEASRELVQQTSTLAKLMRKVLNFSVEESVSIEEEIDLIKTYLDSQIIRGQIEINLGIEIGEDIDIAEQKIPPLITQPLIENCIEHGFKGLKKGTIEISINRKSSYLEIIIQDDGLGFPEKQIDENSKGISIIQDRLNLLNDRSNSNFRLDITNLSVEDSSKRGTKATISLPLNL